MSAQGEKLYGITINIILNRVFILAVSYLKFMNFDG